MIHDNGFTDTPIWDEDPATVGDYLREPARAGNEERFEDLVDAVLVDFVGETSGGERLSDPVFQAMLDIMKDASLSKLTNSHKLFVSLEHEWNALSDSQRERLIEGLKASYGTFEDDLTDFVISELLGEYYCDERAFSVLCELADPRPRPRVFVPHGFEHIVSGAKDEDLRQRALGRLMQMKADPSPKVRDEVKESLGRLGMLGPDHLVE